MDTVRFIKRNEESHTMTNLQTCSQELCQRLLPDANTVSFFMSPDRQEAVINQKSIIQVYRVIFIFYIWKKIYCNPKHLRQSNVKIYFHWCIFFCFILLNLCFSISVKMRARRGPKYGYSQISQNKWREP